MRKIYRSSLIALVFLVILFAGVSFAKSDAELAEELAQEVLRNVKCTSTTFNYEGKTPELPIICISKAEIENVIDGIEGTEGKNITAELTNQGTIKVVVGGEIYEETIAIGTSNSARSL